jgi:hypothetical protein
MSARTIPHLLLILAFLALPAVTSLGGNVDPRQLSELPVNGAVVSGRLGSHVTAHAQSRRAIRRADQLVRKQRRDSAVLAAGPA